MENGPFRSRFDHQRPRSEALGISPFPAYAETEIFTSVALAISRSMTNDLSY
jgi:hypothetical protein